MFKVGQIVTAKKLGIYNITDYMKPLQVISSSHNLTEVKPLWTGVTTYTLENNTLRVMLESEIFKEGDTIVVDDIGVKSSVEFLGYNDFGVVVMTEKGFKECYAMNKVLFDEIRRKGLYVS